MGTIVKITPYGRIFTFPPGLGAFMAADQYAPLVEETASAWGLPVQLLKNQVNLESGYKPDMVSSAGAVGMLQLLPNTAAAVAARHKLPDGPLTDPKINLNLGAAYMSDLYYTASKFHPDNWEAYKLALVGYFAGPARIEAIASGKTLIKANEASYINKALSGATRESVLLPPPLPPESRPLQAIVLEKTKGYWIALAALIAAGFYLFF